MLLALRSEKALWITSKVETVGSKYHTEWWIPADDLETLNDNIVGVIEVIHEESC